MSSDQPMTWLWDEAKNDYYYLSNDYYRVYNQGYRVYNGPPVRPNLNEPRYTPPIEQSAAPGYTFSAPSHSAPQGGGYTTSNSVTYSDPYSQQRQYTHSGYNATANPSSAYHYGSPPQQSQQQHTETSTNTNKINVQSGFSENRYTSKQSENEYWQHKRDQRNRAEHNQNQENRPGGQGPSTETGEEEEDEEDEDERGEDEEDEDEEEDEEE